MDERFAGMASGAKTKFAEQAIELRPHARDPIGRGGQRGAGPHARMDRQRNDLTAFEHGHDEQIERHLAVDQRDAVGLDDQRRARRFGAAIPGPIKPRKRAFIRGIREQRRSGGAAHPQCFPNAAIAAADNVAELSEHAVSEPAEQRCAFLIGQGARIILHRGLHARPIGDGGVNISQRSV